MTFQPSGLNLNSQRVCPACQIKATLRSFIRKGDDTPSNTCNYCAAKPPETKNAPLSTVALNDNALDEISPFRPTGYRVDPVVLARQEENKRTGQKLPVVRRGEVLYRKGT